MQTLHVSFECFPAAKVGGLADVVGALPKYLNQIGIESAVVIPKFSTVWLNNAVYAEDFRGTFRWHFGNVSFRILRENSNTLGYNLYVVELNELFLRPGIYNDTERNIPYGDDAERFIAFQLAVLTWVRQFQNKPFVIHCHDHHTGLIPVFMKFSIEFDSLKNIPTVFTIHNGLYQGQFSWNKKHLFPLLSDESFAVLDWDNYVNPMAAAVKCANVVTTVSPGYMQELFQSANGLEILFQRFSYKCIGILNGIDDEIWNPATDKNLFANYSNDISIYKLANKNGLIKKYNFNNSLPLFTFIGRLVNEKGADLLPGLINEILQRDRNVNFIVLGSGAGDIEYNLQQVAMHYHNNFVFEKGYNEPLAHQLYAGADFLLMPSRIEPCGLNQMYAMRYATIPIVTKTGGLKDTVNDIGEENGRGFQLWYSTINDLVIAAGRAKDLFYHPDNLLQIQKRISSVDFSWKTSAKNYVKVYESINNKITTI